MRRFRDRTIRQKLIAIQVGTAFAVIVLCVVAFAVNDYNAFRDEQIVRMTTVAQLLGANSVSAIEFLDARAAAATLETAALEEDLIDAAIATPDGEVFARFRRDPLDEFEFDVRPEPYQEFHDEYVVLSRPIVRDDRTLGQIYLRSDTTRFEQVLAGYFRIVALVIVSGIVLALILSDLTQRAISVPVRRLRDASRNVAQTKDYSLRIPYSGQDELGELVAGFNQMLEQIQNRDRALQESQSSLEERVRDRTQELSGANETLEIEMQHRRAVQEEILDQRTFLYQIIDANPNLIYVKDRDQNYTHANRAIAELLGTTPKEIVGSRDSDFARSEEEVEIASRRFAAVFETGRTKVNSQELFTNVKTGERRWFQTIRVPMLGRDGAPDSVLGVAADVTERLAMEDDLRSTRDAAESANRSKSEFLANMSHELRTPLNSIIGYSEMLQVMARRNDDTEYLSDLERIHSSGRHLLRLISEVLDLAKVEAGRADIRIEKFDVESLVRDVVNDIRPLAEENGNVLELHCADDVGAMSSDSTRMRQILFNLLSNARKFTSNGTVALRVSRDPGSRGLDSVVFSVSDTGIGMTTEQMGRVFNEFVQADSSTTRKYGGTGLGLSICRSYCEILGGTIAVESELDKGSTFTVRMPAEASPAEAVAEKGRAKTLRDRVRQGPMRVLVIDDDPDARRLLIETLSEAGHEVSGAEGGDEGVEMARRIKPDAITLDVLMPDVSGWDVLAALKTDPKLAEIPIVMVSMLDERARGCALGATDYLVKPVDRRQLLDVIERHTGGGPPGTVLVVEDDPQTREYIEPLLVKQGWTVELAFDGRHALDRVERQAPSLILLDLLLPKMDGFEFVQELRERDEWKAIPVVVLTAKTLTDQERSRLNGSVARVFEKTGLNRDELMIELRQRFSPDP